MKNILSVFSGFFLALLLAEIILRFLPVSYGWTNSYPTVENPLIHYTPQARFCSSRGWNLKNSITGNFNNYGYVSSFDYKKTDDILAVIGDSFIEAGMINDGKRLHEKLKSELSGKFNVIGLGQSGADLADFYKTAAWAQKEFSPKMYVFLIGDSDIKQAGTSKIRGFWFKEDAGKITIASQAKIKARNMLFSSRVMTYLFLNLKFDPKKYFRKKTDGKLIPSITLSTLERQWADWFFDHIDDITGVEKENIIFLVNATTDVMYADQSKDNYREAIITLAQSKGYPVIDMLEVFRKDYQINQHSFGIGIEDSHWNEYGHAVAAKATSSLIDTLSQRSLSRARGVHIRNN